MAVYTEVPDGDLAAFLELYDLGHLVSCKGIAEGVENSNYLLQTTEGNFILTLYEKRVDRNDLPFFLGLMDHLAAKGLSCPTPIKARNGGPCMSSAAGRRSSSVSSKVSGRADPPRSIASNWAAPSPTSTSRAATS